AEAPAAVRVAVAPGVAAELAAVPGVVAPGVAAEVLVAALAAGGRGADRAALASVAAAVAAAAGRAVAAASFLRRSAPAPGPRRSLGREARHGRAPSALPT